MAYLYLYNSTQTTCKYEIELSNPFNSTYYYAIRITGTYRGSETGSIPTCVHHKDETGSSSKYVYGTITDWLNPGQTYTLYGYAQARNGTWYLIGSDTITMQDEMGALTGLYVLSTTASSIRVAWNSTYGAYDYEIDVDGAYRGWTSGTSYTLTGLDSDTRYKIAVYPCDNNGNRGTGDYVYAWTNVSVPSKPSPPYLYSESYRYEGGFMADWYSVSGATEYDFSIALQGGSPTFYYNITRTYKDFPSGDLGYGSTYELRVRACNNYGCSPYSNLSLLTTRPKRPSLSTSIAGTTLSVVVTGLTGNYTDVTVYLRDSSGTELQSKTATYNNQTVTFTLSPNTDYKVNGRTRLYVHQTNLYSNYTTLISASVQKPSLWYWTTAETNAFNNNGLVTVLTYTRWNSFIDKVNEFRTYAGKSSIGGKIYSSNKTLTAVKFVTVAQGIRDMTSYLAVELTQVQQGDIVWGWYFPHLSSRLDYV